MDTTHDFTILALPVGGLRDLPLAVSASRCGALGVVDLAFTRDLAGLTKRLSPAVASGITRLGLRFDLAQLESNPAVLSDLPEVIDTILITGRIAASLRTIVRRIQNANRTVVLEVTSLEEATAGEGAGVDAIIAKGHEGAGRIGEKTTFILLQQIVPRVSVPVYAQGGVGLRTAAGCWACGARGFVLDWQLSLLRESALSDGMKDRVRKMDGRESGAFGRSCGDLHRLMVPGGPKAAAALESEEISLAAEHDGDAEAARTAWRDLVLRRMAGPEDQRILPLSQDVAFAARWAERYRSVACLIDGLRDRTNEHLELAVEQRPLAQDNLLAAGMGVRYPIVQGPMSRVSDQAAFADAVSREGAMPVLAVAAMQPDELEDMLRETDGTLGDRPWGVGLLGFLDRELLDQQLALVKKYRPSLAVVAGGKPAQAIQLEAEGIQAYIHIPSARLLSHYLQEGARNFIFEGRECGGHIGPYAASVLWENVIECILAEVPVDQAREVGVLFAGGIHDDVSAALVAAVSAPLVARGMRVGVLMATAYLFTHEAVEAGAIGDIFQQQLIDADRTDILDSGGGYEVRSAPSPFTRTFQEEKARMRREGKSAEEIRDALELLNLGRLRIAAKGIAFNLRSLDDPTADTLLSVTPEAQIDDGCFMAGQLLSLRDRTTTMAELHATVSGGAADRLASLPRAHGTVIVERLDEPAACEVAIVGMSSIFPRAPDLTSYWNNILNEVYAIREVPADRWDAQRYFDSDRQTRDRTYSKWGGFIDPIRFDPTKFAIPPRSMRSIDPLQLFPLEVVDRLLHHAGYGDRDFDRERTAVIFGVSGGMGDWGLMYGVRTALPLLFEDPPAEVLDQLPEWTEDSFPGVLANVVAGRIANCFDFGGPNFTVDAACGSGLTAVYTAVREITSGICDSAIVGASDVMQNPFSFLCFSKTHALSPTGTPRPFDADADGIAISEGVASVFLKRRDLAERDGDTIYAVIRGVGASSDGRGASMTAPQKIGQRRAFDRAYQRAGFSAERLGLVEAHGTGTALGDGVEASSIYDLLTAAGARPGACAVGSVKSMIGHTKGCAGIAGMIKVALALHHKVLPPTLGVRQLARPECWTESSPMYISGRARPWIADGRPRCAGVDAFGFGGSNFHAVVEEYTAPAAAPAACPLDDWPWELFVWSGPTVDALRGTLDAFQRSLNRASGVTLAELAAVVSRGAPSGGLRLAIVAEDRDDLAGKVGAALTKLAAGESRIRDASGIFFSADPLGAGHGVAFLYPGQASQKPGMMQDLCILFPEMNEVFSVANAVIGDRLAKPLSDYVYPPTRLEADADERNMAALTATDVAQPALAAVDAGLHEVLRVFGITPDAVAGHSVGEYIALYAAGSITDEQLFDILWKRGRSVVDACGDDPGTMLAIRGGWDVVRDIVDAAPNVYLANLNSPSQTILSGRPEDLAAIAGQLSERGISSVPIAVSYGFHSPFVAAAVKPFAEALAGVPFQAPKIPTYTNQTAAPYEGDAAAMRTQLSSHLHDPVRWTEQIRAMADDGIRIFVEVGPGRVLSGLVKSILGDVEHVTITPGHAGRRHDLFGLCSTLGGAGCGGCRCRCDAAVHAPHDSGPGSANPGPDRWRRGVEARSLDTGAGPRVARGGGTTRHPSCTGPGGASCTGARPRRPHAGACAGGGPGPGHRARAGVGPVPATDGADDPTAEGRHDGVSWRPGNPVRRRPPAHAPDAAVGRSTCDGTGRSVSARAGRGARGSRTRAARTRGAGCSRS